MTAEGAKPGGVRGPNGPPPHKEKVFPHYTFWPKTAEPGNLGPPVGNDMLRAACLHTDQLRIFGFPAFDKIRGWEPD